MISKLFPIVRTHGIKFIKTEKRRNFMGLPGFPMFWKFLKKSFFCEINEMILFYGIDSNFLGVFFDLWKNEITIRISDTVVNEVNLSLET